MKRRIRLTEKDLHRIIKESVKSLINEISIDDPEFIEAWNYPRNGKSDSENIMNGQINQHLKSKGLSKGPNSYEVDALKRNSIKKAPLDKNGSASMKMPSYRDISEDDEKGMIDAYNHYLYARRVLYDVKKTDRAKKLFDFYVTSLFPNFDFYQYFNSGMKKISNSKEWEDFTGRRQVIERIYDYDDFGGALSETQVDLLNTLLRQTEQYN